MSDITRDYYTVDQFAALQGVHRKTVYRWIRQDLAPKHELLGRMYWIEKKDAATWQPKDGRRKENK